MIRFSIVVIISSIAAASMAVPFQEDLIPAPQKPHQVQDGDRIILTEEDAAKSLSRRDFMRTKLMFSQNIFEGLTTGNWPLIERSIREVQLVTQGEHWVAINDNRYRKLTSEFNTSTKRLMQAAKTKNLDATALRYYNMSTSCIDCHKHIRKAGYKL